MATIPRSYLDALTEALNTLSDATRRAVLVQLAAITYKSIEDLRDKVIAFLVPLLESTTNDAAAYSANAYDAIREYSTGAALGATTYSGYTSEATEGAVRGMVDVVKKGKPWDMFVEKVLDRCDYEIKRAAGESVAYNSDHDKKSRGYARVPQGSETCGFCLMLASFGYKHGDRDKVKHAHSNCKCAIVPWFDGMEIDGYDPDGMYDRFNQCLDTLGGRNGIRADWDAMPEDERKAYIQDHGGKESDAFQAYMNKRLADEIESRDPDWFKNGEKRSTKKVAEQSGNSDTSFVSGIRDDLAKKQIKLPKKEYANVMSAINTSYYARFEGKPGGIIYVSQDDDYYAYHFLINEFGDYIIIGKEEI